MINDIIVTFWLRRRPKQAPFEVRHEDLEIYFLLKYHPPTFFRTPLYNIMCEKCISTSFYNSDPFPSHPYPSVALPLDFNILIDVYNH